MVYFKKNRPPKKRKKDREKCPIKGVDEPSKTGGGHPLGKSYYFRGSSFTTSGGYPAPAAHPPWYFHFAHLIFLNKYFEGVKQRQWGDENFSGDGYIPFCTFYNFSLGGNPLCTPAGLL